MTLFQKNRSAIRRISPELAQRLDGVSKERRNVQLFPSREGPMTCRVVGDDGRSVTLHSTVNPRIESTLVGKKFEAAGEGIVVLVGMGLGYPLLGLLNHGDFKGRAIVLVERDLCLFRKAMELFDWTPLLAKGELHFLIDEELEKILDTITRIRMKRGFENLVLISHGPSLRTDPDFYGPLMDQLRPMEESPFRVKKDSLPFSRDRLTVLVLDSNYFLIRECIKALKKLGHNVLRVSVSDGGLLETILKRVAQDKPDFLLSVNHLGFDEDGKLTEVLEDLNLPFAVWYVDSPTFIIRNFKKNASQNCVLFAWDRSYLERMNEYGFRKSLFLPLATDPSVFRPIRRRSVPARFQSAISFVGNSMVEAVEDWFGRFPNDGVIDEICRLAIPLQISNHQRPIEEILENIANGHGLRSEFKDPAHYLDLQGALVWRATLEYRRNLVESLEPFDIRVFGDEGWHQILNGAIKIFPSVSYYHELPLIFNGTDINLNATSFQMNLAVNQRVFDVAACGAFLITDHQPDMDDFFEIDREAVCYRNAAEARDLVAYYLKHPRDRGEISKRARRRVLDEHTYEHRLGTMIGLLKDEFGSFRSEGIKGQKGKSRRKI